MRLTTWTNYLLSHRIIALALTFIISFIPLIGILGIMFAALVTIRKGVLWGAIFTLASTLPYCFMRIFVPSSEAVTPAFIWIAIGIGTLSDVLTWVFAVMIRRRASWSTILQIAALMGVLVISVVHLAYPDIATWWGEQLQSFNSQVHDTVADKLKDSVDIDSLKEAQAKAVNAAKLIATGAIVAMTLWAAIVPLALACWWNAVVFSPGSLRRGLHNIRLSPLAGVLFIISLVFSYLGNSVVLDIMPVLYLLFCTAGLSVLHFFFERIKTPVVWFWLILMYFTLFIAAPNSIVLVATIALLDIWLDFRRRFKVGNAGS